MEERLCKIVWNDKGWVQPIKRKYNAENDIKRGYEHKYGFVYEDWLLNKKGVVLIKDSYRVILLARLGL